MDSAMLHCAICLIFLLPINVLSQISSPNVNTIALGSSLTAKKGNSSSWTSRSGDFAFGFIQPPTGGGGYLLAIWFNKIPEKTVIWSANRDKLAPEGSTIQLVEDGRFVLNDPTGQNIWNAGTGGGAGVSYGVMQDTGNFVLLARNTSSSSFLWQSFDFPTDTLLPSQSLIEGQKIVSNLSATNYASGKFQLTNDSNGNLVLYRTTEPLAALNFPYLATSGGRFRRNDSKYLFNESGGNISLVSKNGSLVNSDLFAFQTVSINQYYQRLTLDYDGLLRYYVYPKNTSSSSTAGAGVMPPMTWSILHYEPPDICLSNSQAAGGGICGYNGLCSWNTNNNKTVCLCPPGYSFIDPNDTMMGCKLNFLPQSCMLNETQLFTLNDTFNTNWPTFLPVGKESQEFEHYQFMTEEQCKQICLNDCLCAAAYFQGNDCYKKYLPLVNGRIDQSVVGKAMVKVRLGNSSTINTPDPTSNTNPIKKWKDNKLIIIIGSLLLGGSLLVNILILLATLFFGKLLFKKKVDTQVAANSVLHGLNMRTFSYQELEDATNGFTEELGSGAGSVVYKGTLKHHGMQLVAVKKLRNNINMVKTEAEFTAEVSSISRTNHKNLVQMLGYCSEGQHRLLVYEYMSNGSLANFIFDNPRPNWYKRVQIASTTAKGLYYLHEECRSQIIHCDIKPQNVLLDESLTAKISDFGLAKLLKQDQTKTMTGVRGTRGYVAPEWFKNMPITSKVDVYSFGILLLELICCKKNIENTNIGDDQKEDDVILSDWAYYCYDEKKLDMLIANDEEALNDMRRVEKLVGIAMWCIQEDPSIRPSMKRVVQMLEGSISVSVPPNPWTSIC